jgi:hypothetical protein
MGTIHTIPARRGKAARLNRGQAIKISNPHGKQVVDTWAFVASSTLEYMGMEQCRAFWERLYSYCVINVCAVLGVQLERRNTDIVAGF